MEKILVLDDFEPQAELIADVVEMGGAKPVKAHSIAEAQDQMERDPKLNRAVCDFHLDPNGGLNGPYSTPIVEQILSRKGKVVLLSSDTSAEGIKSLEARYSGKGLVVGKNKNDFDSIRATFKLRT